MDSDRIGVISDTHGLLRPEALAALAGVGHILHGGDISDPAHLDRLARIAPLHAIRGNVDRGDWADALPETRTITLAGMQIYMIHDLKALDFDPAARGIDVVISGHSHAPRIAEEGGVLYLNPGAAGRRRFRLPITLAYLWAENGRPRAELHPLPV
ncbi:metallophosphoesterase family protein [Mesobaculum littorinae]|uniref:metallophosphoesterase family protein n=1 Tax=Mesobaculum littorinae TaxID=2486419 RepID=UPI001F4094CF|nr:metallophosphoesterase family protein [Mesobaculum littorinae]